MPDQSIFFQLHPSLKQVIHQTLQWKELRRIQELAFDPVCSGADILLTARTAGGKSEAAFIPVLDLILKQHPDLPVCLYISPLKALITDISDRLDRLLTPLHLSVIQVHGDIPGSSIQVSDPPAVILTTPESLTILLHGESASILVDRITICIIDEVHSLAASERGSQLMATLTLMEQRSGHKIQRIGLSATVGNPDDVLAWMSGKNVCSLVVSAEHETLPREFIFLCGWDGSEKGRVLSLIRQRRSLIFARSRGEAETLSSLLEGSDFPVFVHHSSLSPRSRREAELVFTRGKPGTIICTGTLELGIDIGSLDLVVHSGPVVSVSSFLQRLGRVGRRGDCAQMAFLIRDPGEMIMVAAAITAAVSGLVEPVWIIRYPYRVLVQQIILTLHARSRIPRVTLINCLLACDTGNIGEGQIMLIISSLIRNGYLLVDQDYFMSGPLLESWMDQQRGSLYSVIGEGKTCTVRSPEGDLIGTVSTKGVGLCRTGSFRLGGKSWMSTGTHPDPVTVQVHQVSFQAVPPVFGGSIQGTSFLLMQQVAGIARYGLVDLPFPDLVRAIVQDFITSLPCESGPDTIVVRKEGESMYIYTFLGDEWNRALYHYLKEEGKKKKIRLLAGGSDGISVKLSSPDLTPEWVQNTLLDIRRSDPAYPGEWIGSFLETGSPWDQFLPEECQREMLIFDKFRLDVLIRELSSRTIVLSTDIRV
jgi:ATP-dependent helicase Lhr and Lhr-like helicase